MRLSTSSATWNVMNAKPEPFMTKLEHFNKLKILFTMLLLMEMSTTPNEAVATTEEAVATVVDVEVEADSAEISHNRTAEMEAVTDHNRKDENATNVDILFRMLEIIAQLKTIPATIVESKVI